MVKAKTDYERRMDDSRFKHFDAALDPSHGQKQYYILMLGILIVGGLFASSIAMSYLNTPTTQTTALYENGLNISYSPNEKLFYVSFTNPNNDTISLSTIIQIPFDSTQSATNYIPVYTYSTSKFPLNITYIPSQKVSNLNHIVLVTLVKETGNYTYTYSAIPDTENKMWQGTGQYVQKISGVFNVS